MDFNWKWNETSEVKGNMITDIHWRQGNVPMQRLSRTANTGREEKGTSQEFCESFILENMNMESETLT